MLLMASSIILIGIAIFIVSFGIFKDDEQFKAVETLNEVENRSQKNLGIIIKYSRKFYRRYLLPIVNGMKNKKEIRTKYKRKLAAAGLTAEMTPEEFFAFKLFLILGFPVVYLFFRQILGEDWPLLYVPVAAVLGFLYPNFWLKGLIGKRRKEIIFNMPFVVDMLALSVEAGLDFMAAISRVLEKAPPSALAEEFEILIKETRIGASRADALRNMAWRVDMIQMSSFTATLIAADSVGASIGPILKTLSNDMRSKRSALAEKAGAQAAAKMLLPMIFLVLPAVLIMMAAPLLLEAMGFRK